MTTARHDTPRPSPRHAAPEPDDPATGATSATVPAPRGPDDVPPRTVAEGKARNDTDDSPVDGVSDGTVRGAGAGGGPGDGVADDTARGVAGDGGGAVASGPGAGEGAPAVATDSGPAPGTPAPDGAAREPRTVGELVGVAGATAGAPHAWVGRTVHGRDGAVLGRLADAYPSGPTTWGAVRSRFGRTRTLVPLDGAAESGDDGLTVPVDRAAFRTAPAVDRSPDEHARTSLERHYAGRGALADAGARQHERFGGMKLGAAFFGWVVAVGLTVILAAVAVGIAALTGFRFDLSGSAAAPPPETVGLVGAAIAVVVLGVAYFGGGYVAGRLARFDGARNGVATWLLGLAVSIAAVAGAAVAGARFDVLDRVVLPSIALPTGALTVGGIVLAVVVALVCLATSALGGRAGEHYHRRVDRVGSAVD